MRVVIAEDSLLLREGLARLLGDAGHEVAGRWETGEELLAHVRGDPPDIAIVDIRQPPARDDDGLRAAVELRAHHPSVKVLVLSQYGASTDEAISRGIRSTAGVVTSAAIVMVAVFSIFATLSMMIFKQFGVGLAAAILIDATIVRAVLLPATMKLLGERNWYLPKWLEWIPHFEHAEAPASAQPSGRARGAAPATPGTTVRR